jgi:hypothetical protein
VRQPQTAVRFDLEEPDPVGAERDGDTVDGGADERSDVTGARRGRGEPAKRLEQDAVIGGTAAPQDRARRLPETGLSWGLGRHVPRALLGSGRSRARQRTNERFARQRAVARSAP